MKIDRNQTQRLSKVSENIQFTRIRNKANHKDSLSKLSDAIDHIKSKR